MWDVADGNGVVHLAAAAQRAALLPTYTAHAADALALAALAILVLRGMGRCDLARQVAWQADSLLMLPGTLLVEMIFCTQQAASIVVHGFLALLRWGLLALAAILILLALAAIVRTYHPAGRGMRLQHFVEGLLIEWVRTAAHAAQRAMARGVRQETGRAH